MFKELTYRVTTHFNEIDSFHKLPHTGVDFATPLGTQVQSISDGTVSKIAVDLMLGQNIRVQTGAGKEWVYGHLNAVTAKVGETVHSGDQLGLSGGSVGTYGSGHTTGPHLHITLLQNGTPVDPTTALAATPPDDGGSWWSGIDHILNTPGTTLAGMAPTYADYWKGSGTITDKVLHFIGTGLTTGVHVMPEVCGIMAMVLLLAGMCGSHRAMRAAGTAVLLMFVGTILNAAIS